MHTYIYIYTYVYNIIQQVHVTCMSCESNPSKFTPGAGACSQQGAIGSQTEGGLASKLHLEDVFTGLTGETGRFYGEHVVFLMVKMAGLMESSL